MIYLHQLADVARRTGYPVVEQGAWPTRSNSHGGFDVLRGITVHHTASGVSSDGPSDANYITYNSDSAPISNFYISRNGTIYVCAGGSCNHGGKGGPYKTPLGTINQDRVNFEAISIEIGNAGNGTDLYPNSQIDSCAKLCAELCKDLGWTDELVVFAHKEWCGPGTTTPGRKIDPYGPWQDGRNWAGYQDRIDAFRAYVKSQFTQETPVPIPGDDDVPNTLVRNGTDAAWNAWICHPSGKFWLSTGEALEKAKKDYGYDPIPVDHVFMEASGPVFGPNPTNDVYGRY